MSQARYAYSLARRLRLPTVEVPIGDVPLGGSNPVRIQSMTTTDTLDTIGTVEQTLRMVESGCEYVRITAPNVAAAENLKNIKAELRKRGCKVPLVADIHFTPNAAEIAARVVEKVRVNPGNYADRKAFKTIEYGDAEYAAEIERIAERFSPLVKICKEHGTAMRIGTNHGSLSDRIMSRYGDTPEGMVASALEFLDICESHSYHAIVLSMKASNTQVMVQAYRLLVSKMLERGRLYPLHLGVTEAGEGEDGRIKSAVGIGSLLLDGLGDTVRVSLTEDPEYEAPVAKAIVETFTRPVNDACLGEYSPSWNPFAFRRRGSLNVKGIGAGETPVVVASTKSPLADEKVLDRLGWKADEESNFTRLDQSADYLAHEGDETEELSPTLPVVRPAATWSRLKKREPVFPLFESPVAFAASADRHDRLNFVRIRRSDLKGLPEGFGNQAVVLVLQTESADVTREARWLIRKLDSLGIEAPVLFSWPSVDASPAPIPAAAAIQVRRACQVGALLIDGLLDGFFLPDATSEDVRLAFNLLQASRLRMSKTEYISCPSCGRTQFNLQEVSAKIRKRTEHLKGVKIAVMGCIVNGPGEMADADFGYVGTGPGKISLYKGFQVVEKMLDEEVAVDHLVELIRSHGKWVEPPTAATGARKG